MSTYDDRPKRALIVVDMQVGVVRGAHQIDEVTSIIKELIEQARRADVPVIWVQDHAGQRAIGSGDWQLVEGLDPLEDEPRVGKAFGDAFADTELEEVLRDRGVGELVLVGAASEQCVRCTMHSAVVRGYDVALVKGAHTTTDMTAWGMPEPGVVIGFMDMMAAFGMQWPGRGARSVTPEQVAF